MKAVNEKEVGKAEMSFIILLAASAVPVILIEKYPEKISAIFYLTLLLICINVYAYIKCRKSQNLKSSLKFRLITILSVAVATWTFLSALLIFSPELNYKSFLIINKISGSISDYGIYSSEALAFFIGNILLLALVLTEMIPAYKRVLSYYRTVYISICAVSVYIILNYLVLFPKILTATPVVKLIYVNEGLMIKPNQLPELYFDGAVFESRIDASEKAWYLNGKLIGSENICTPSSKGKYYAKITTEKGIIRSQTYKY